MTVERSTVRERQWQAWAGTVGDLSRLGDAIAQMVELRRNAALQEFDEETKRLNNEEGSWLDWNAERKADRDILERDVVRSTASEGTDKASGSMEDILPEIDRRTTDTVSFEYRSPSLRLASRSGDTLRVRLSRSGHRPGVTLEVVSSNQGWAKQTAVHLDEEIEKGKPGWAWVHTPIGIAALFAAVFLVVAITVTLILWPHIGGKYAGTISVLLGSAIGCPIGTACISAKPREWFFPRFEIYGESGASSGYRRAGYLVGLVSALVIGIVVNLIS